MKTIDKKRSFRYQKVLNRHDKVAVELMELMDMSAQEYFMYEFEGGMQLLDLYFNESEGAAKLKKLLAYNKRYCFWPFYRLGRRQNEVKFWHSYRPVYDQEGEYLTEEEQRSELVEEWKLEMRAYNEYQETHEKLRQHILQSRIPI